MNTAVSPDKAVILLWHTTDSPREPYCGATKAVLDRLVIRDALEWWYEYSIHPLFFLQMPLSPAAAVVIRLVAFPLLLLLGVLVVPFRTSRRPRARYLSPWCNNGACPVTADLIMRVSVRKQQRNTVSSRNQLGGWTKPVHDWK